MFFHKKQETKPIPIDEINSMTSRGMSDKDIIKTLKSKGYSYNEIEKAMLSAVKSGISQEKPSKKRPELQAPQPAPQRQQQPPQDFSYDFGEQSTEETFDNMAPDDIFAGQEQPQFENLPQFTQEQQQPVEELVEGLIEEKWQHFQDEMSRFEEDLERIRADMKVFEERIDAAKRESPTGEVEARVNELVEHVDDLDARVGGLERAFKQLLPSLTRNIESLSAMITEMKAKQQPKSFA